MKRIVVVAVLLAAVPSAAPGAFKGIEAKGDVGHLSDVDGQVVLLSARGFGLRAGDWDLSAPSARTGIKLWSGKRYGSYLGYDPKGKDPSVKLVDKGEADPPQWQVSKEGRGYVIRAAEGKYKGWHLDAGDEVKHKGKVIGRKAVLTEKPKKPLVFSIYEIGG